MKNLNELSQPKRSWLVAEVKISYHNQSKASDYPKINTSTEAELILRKNWSDDMELLEEFNALFLNRANGVKGFFHLSRGGVSNTYVDLKILFSAGLKALASSIILAHNHPSGNIKPSKADLELTKKVLEAGKLLDIQIIDHLILIPNSGYYSFADEGTL